MAVSISLEHPVILAHISIKEWKPSSSRADPQSSIPFFANDDLERNGTSESVSALVSCLTLES